MHQLRVQCGERGWPIVGDGLYGSGRAFSPDAIALHARRLDFRHPRDDRAMTIEAALPASWSSRDWLLDPERP
jgi:23S rRNA-/tRNA-specific pseudouridylate synthase